MFVYKHVRHQARERIYEATGYDFVNNGPGDIYTYCNCMANCTEEGRERLIAGLAAHDIEEK